MRKVSLLLCLLCLAFARAEARDFYGMLDIGYGSLLSPDVSGAGVREGGFTAFFRGLFGGDELKYGAEFGVMEVYTSWDKDRLNIEKSQILIPLLATARYEFGSGGLVPYAGISAGPCFAIEHFNNSRSGVNSSGSSTVRGGAMLSAGLKIKTNSKYDADVSCRYSVVNASENISMLGVYVGLGANVPFFSEDKAGKAAERLKQKTQ